MVTPSYARRVPWSSRLGIAMGLAVVVIACGASPRAATPSQSLLAQAETAERARDYGQARALYRRAITAAAGAPERAHATRRFALALMFWGEYPAAQRELEATVRLTPHHAPSWHDLGILRHRLGNDAGAEHALRRSVAASPRDPRSRIALAALLARNRRWAAALAEYRGLLRLSLPERLRDKVTWAIRAIERESQRRP